MSQANLRARKADAGRLPMVGAQGEAWGRTSEARDLAGRACGREGTFLKPAVVRDPALQVYLEVPPL